MADRKDSKTPSKGGVIKKKEKKVEKVESKPEKEKEKNKDKNEKMTKKPEKAPENQQKNEEAPQGNGEVAEGAERPVKDEEFELEPMELPPFEIIVGYVKHLSLTHLDPTVIFSARTVVHPQEKKCSLSLDQ